MNQGTKALPAQQEDENEQQHMINPCLLGRIGKNAPNEPQNHQNSEQEGEAHGRN